VWDGCYERDIEKLEKIQLEAARIVTGICIKSKFFPEYDNEVSSANSLAKLPKLSVMSLIYNKNYKYTYNFIFEHSLLYAYQSGFIRGHSTVYQLLEMYHATKS
jgi:hypothetical protein